MNMKEESEKASLKLSIQKTKIMAPSPITSWQIDGETMETVTVYFGGAPKSLQMLTAAMKLKATRSSDGKLSHLDNLLKSRDITLPTNVRIV